MMTVPGKTIRNVGITGTGAYLPERVLTNVELESLVDTDDQWIQSRTGIQERRIAAPDEAASDMGIQAAERALEAAGLAAGEVEAIFTATSTPDMIFPSTACVIQEALGAEKAFCMDLAAACSGYLYAQYTAQQYIASGAVQNALVIGTEKMSCIVDWQDRATCILFGDGAGASVLQPVEQGRGLTATLLGANGALSDLLKVPGGGSRIPATEASVRNREHTIKMQGREVFKYAVNGMANASRSVLEQAGVSIEDVACIIPHQANARIIKAIARQLGASLDSFYINVEKYGNTSAASVIVALDEAVRAGRITKGDLVLLVVFGAGFTWGASLLEW